MAARAKKSSTISSNRKMFLGLVATVAGYREVNTELDMWRFSMNGDLLPGLGQRNQQMFAR